MSQETRRDKTGKLVKALILARRRCGGQARPGSAEADENLSSACVVGWAECCLSES